MKVKKLHKVDVQGKIIVTGEQVPDSGWLAFPTFAATCEIATRVNAKYAAIKAAREADQKKSRMKFAVTASSYGRKFKDA